MSVRRELKYLLRETERERFRTAIAPFVQGDAHASGTVPTYTVRSLYYDTPGLRDYAEKESGIQSRRKVRVRAYDAPGASPVFLEVKRKQGGAVWKDRAALAPTVAAALLAGAPLDAVPEPQRVAAERFLFRLRGERRRPVLLVTYDREPYVGRLDPSLRITFDRRLRCAPFATPGADLGGLFSDALRPTLPGQLILEVKYDRTFPSWLRALIGSFGLRRQALSKYGLGLEDAAHRRPWRFGPSAVRALSALPSQV